MGARLGGLKEGFLFFRRAVLHIKCSGTAACGRGGASNPIQIETATGFLFSEPILEVLLSQHSFLGQLRLDCGDKQHLTQSLC
jgi:hypothetical protein